MELVTIIVPIYNVEDYLEDCITSLIRQTYSNIEIILVDDGSTDRCPQICDEYLKKDRRIKVIHKKNGGLSDARNIGLESAKGRYVSFVDSDDWIELTMIQHLYETCIDFNAQIACCGRYITDGNSVVTSKFKGDRRAFSSKRAIEEAMLGSSIDVAAWDKLYHVDVFKDIRYPVGENNEDIATFYKIFNNAEIIAHCGTCEYYYRNRPGSITKLNYRKRDRQIIFKNLDNLETFINEKYPENIYAFERYKVMNIYFLLNKYIKSYVMIDNEEYLLLIKNFNKYKKSFFKDKNMNNKDKFIACLILCRLYDKYLNFKNKIIGFK